MLCKQNKTKKQSKQTQQQNIRTEQNSSITERSLFFSTASPQKSKQMRLYPPLLQLTLFSVNSSVVKPLQKDHVHQRRSHLQHKGLKSCVLLHQTKDMQNKSPLCSQLCNMRGVGMQHCSQGLLHCSTGQCARGKCWADVSCQQ